MTRTAPVAATLIALGLALAAPAQAGNVLAYVDDYTGTMDDAAAALGHTVSLYDQYNPAGFASAASAGGWDIVVISADNWTLDPAMDGAIATVTGGGTPLAIGYWRIHINPGIMSSLGLTSASPYYFPVNHMTAPGAAADFFASTGGVLQGWTSDWGVNGHYYGGGWAAGTDGVGNTFVVTNGDSTIVNGFLAADFRAADMDADGTLDTQEIYMEELAYLDGGGLRLQFTGSCPGVIDIDVTGLTPGGQFAVARASSTGSTTIPSGGCAGTTIGLAAPSLVGIYNSGTGSLSTSNDFGPGWCGDFIQLVDLASCAVSNVAQI